MMLKISGLPSHIKLQELKQIIKQKCNLTDFILDNLVNDANNCKACRIGVTDDRDGSVLIKYLDGLRIGGNILQVLPVAKSQSSDAVAFNQHGNIQQPYTSNVQYNQPLQPINQASSYQWQGQPVTNNYNQPNTYIPNTYAAQPVPVPQHDASQYNVPDSYTQRLQQTNYVMKDTSNTGLDSRGRGVLRDIEIVDTPAMNRFQPSSRYNENEKPAKHSAHPSQLPYGQMSQATHNISPWSQQGSQPSSFTSGTFQKQDMFVDQRDSYSKTTTDIDKRDTYRRYSPGRRIDDDRRSPLRRNDMMKRPSPGRRVSPGRRTSPGGRRPSPGRRISPGHRSAGRISPGHRSVSRRISPGRKFSPGRKISPGRRSSPRASISQGRKLSPGKRTSPRRDIDRSHNRYSPTRHAEQPSRQTAPKQAMFSENYHQNVRENVQYPVPASRQALNTWTQDNFSQVQSHDDRRFEPRPSPRKSRSPTRRDRSPIKDCFKRRSPSPRSPRRSWALEKRRSPGINEAPPPPIWPGQKNYSDLIPEQQKFPAWERPKPNVDKFEHSIRVRSDLGHQVQAEQPTLKQDIRFRAPYKDSPGFRDIDHSRQDFRPIDNEQKMFPETLDLRQERTELRPLPKLDTLFRQDTNARREPYTERKPLQDPEILDKELADIYKRTAEFKKKAEQFRRTDIRKKEENLKHTLGNLEQSRTIPAEERGSFRREERGREYRRDDEVRESRCNDDRSPSGRQDTRFQDYRRDEQRYEGRRADDFERNLETRRNIPRDDDRNRNIHRGDLGDRGDFHRGDLRHNEERDRDMRRREEELRRDENQRNQRPIFRPRNDVEINEKRDKACSDIVEKIFNRNVVLTWVDSYRRKVKEALKISVLKKMHDLFGDNIASFIDLTVKFRAKYNVHDEDNIFRDAIESISNKGTERSPKEYIEGPSKFYRLSPERTNQANIASTYNIPGNWDIAPARSPTLQSQMDQIALNQELIKSQIIQQTSIGLNMYEQQILTAQNMMMPLMASNIMQSPAEEINLYLCKDDFETYNEVQLEYLRKFLFASIEKESHQSVDGWAPDFSFKPMQSLHRYELKTYDERTKDWLLNLDFSQFKLFNILVYTKEELWYERAAIWLPGHSRSKMEPLTKIKMQNCKLEHVKIDKWKFVKKIVTEKGTRIYVDMPPSAARALEQNKMMLSYELQKVNVFLKAVAVDKEAFDQGLLGNSSVDQNTIINAALNCPIPVIPNDANLVKITLKGSKTLPLGQARKIREMLIYQMYKYHQEKGKYKTDFIKYGICLPNYFAVLPENRETRKWLMNVSLGTLNRQPVVVVGSDDDNAKYIKMMVIAPKCLLGIVNPLMIERLRHSNVGVKGLHINLWKPITGLRKADGKSKSVVKMHLTQEEDIRLYGHLNAMYDIDLESVETLISLNYRLEYYDHETKETVYVLPPHNKARLLDIIKRFNKEVTDSYDETNMDISDDDSEEDVVCLG